MPIKTALRKSTIIDLSLSSSNSLFSDISKVSFPSLKYLNAEKNSLDKTYGENDLASIPAFQGGYINFGYWKNICYKNILTIDQRIQASIDLYDLIINSMNFINEDSVLEVGCGQGHGCARVLKNYAVSKLTGIDVTPQQIYRAKKSHKNLLDNQNNLDFQISSAEKMNLPSESYSKIFSLEALQCFVSIKNFAKEALRLLQPGGSLVIASHLSTSAEGYEKVKALIPTVNEGIDRLIPVENVRTIFNDVGFKQVEFKSIGNYVFKGFDKWISQINDSPWTRNIYKTYQQGHLDYYLLILQKN